MRGFNKFSQLKWRDQMNQWEQIYREKQRTVEEAVTLIQPGMSVVLSPCCNEPQTLVEELVRQKNRLAEVVLYNMVVGSPCLYASHFQVRTFLGSPLLNGVSDYIPINLSEIPRFIENEKMDVGLIQVSPPDDKGYCSLGISVDYIPSVIKSASHIIAQVNEEMPWTYGRTLVHVNDIDTFVLSTCSLLGISPGKASLVDQKIGEYVAELIPDRATIQVGVGGLADSIVHALRSKKELGVHSGSITDAVMNLMEEGVITNEHKEIDQHKTVCMTLTGTNRLYHFAHRNPAVELHPANYTHHGGTIARLERFYSINSALEIDITGQVNAEQIGTHPIAGVGGQMDFIRGAQLSKGGGAIIALPSTAKQGTQSRIRLAVKCVTSPKSDIHYVVTEFGIARLFGKTLKQRASELIAVAHPDFRDELRREP
jgi:4-hydroxybutyrate CoA-transferase